MWLIRQLRNPPPPAAGDQGWPKGSGRDPGEDGATVTQPGQDTTLPNETTTANHDQTQV